ncbi:uncharacterized protein LOC113296367 [Papaver somniferum]|uniref:uncharacterized protein LOC113296367 n=1 Tax=Papaver somniferum TaxID=3469 RepID=UPI000E705ECA|nr:uncharacterized protein LOC113296367 [Papaver somniferum]
MRVLFWNINGVARDAAQCKLRELIREFKPDIFCLAEPKVHCSVGFGNRLQLEGFYPHVIHNAAASRIANMWICYLNGIVPSVINRSKQAITVEVDGVHISFVHASYVQVTRRRLWQQLNSHDTSISWLVMGYFNCILRLDEKKGGLEPRTSAINEFSDWMDDNNLFEADFLGTKFTWTNGQSGAHRIISKLDRVVINAAWLKQDQLRFEYVALCSDEDPNDVSKLNLMKDVMARLSETRLQHNSMLKKKARNQWLVEGSSNTTFFHNSIRIRRSSNTISELIDSDGHTISEYDQLREHVVQFYEDKFNVHESDLDASLFDYEHVGISEEESLAMDKIPTPDEIKQAVFDLGDDSAPGPDGFSGCFYRHCWDIINEYLIKAIIFCWNTGHIPNGVNSSLIILLPKVTGANTLRNFRPIGLSNFFFKIFTKILATRVGSVLDKLVSEEQVAFMKGRNIHENISLASEMVNELHIKRKDGNIGLKLDISQAFDTSEGLFQN